MAPKKQTIMHNGALFKAGTNTNIEARSPYVSNCEHITDNSDSSSSQRIATSAQPPLYEGQILQMLADMK